MIPLFPKIYFPIYFAHAGAPAFWVQSVHSHVVYARGLKASYFGDGDNQASLFWARAQITPIKLFWVLVGFCFWVFWAPLNPLIPLQTSLTKVQSLLKLLAMEYAFK
jgi:hypothetical protein